MRCVGCEMDPQAPARYCECCGKELSPQQAHAGSAGHVSAEKKEPVTAHDDWAPKGNSWDLRCPSCGGPSLDRGRCPACQRAADSLGVANVPTAKAAQAKPPAPPPAATSRPVSYTETVYTAPTPKAASTRSDTARMAAMAADNTAAPNPKVIWAARTEGAPPERKPARAAVPARPATPDTAKRALPWVVLSTAVGVVCAISVGAWLFFQEEPVIAGEGESAAAAAVALDSDAVTAPVAPADAVPAAAVPMPDPEPVPAPPAAEPKRAPATSRSKPAAASRNEVPAARKPVAAASSVTPTAPVGPVFELRDVNESPRVATRVEPRLPSALRARKINEIVIVRALVSQSGHPSQVSLLRRSKAGPELDDVVLAAVNEWTFSPARKKGEAVSCWFNFGVSVGRPE